MHASRMLSWDILFLQPYSTLLGVGGMIASTVHTIKWIHTCVITMISFATLDAAWLTFTRVLAMTKLLTSEAPPVVRHIDFYLDPEVPDIDTLWQSS